MRKLILILSISFISLLGYAQSEIDSKYLEDQIYLTLSFDSFLSTPIEFKHNGFSGSFSTGFIKDIPFNKERNFGLGIGFGYGYTAYIQNLRFNDTDYDISLELIDSYKTNWLKQHKIELPIEIRFRGSTATKYKFWRVYAGVKLSYLINSKSKFQDNDLSIEVSNVNSLEKFQYGAIISAGFGTWNLYVYYGLKPIFKDLILDTIKFKAREFKIGLNFYIM